MCRSFHDQIVRTGNVWLDVIQNSVQLCAQEAPIPPSVLPKGSHGHFQGNSQLLLAECELMSRFKEGDHVITTRTEVRKDHRVGSTSGGRTTAGTVIALVPRVVPAWLRSIVTATRAVDQRKREASLKVVELMLPLEVQKLQHPSAPSGDGTAPRRCRQISANKGVIGGPDRDRTDDLFHAMEARSQLRHRPTCRGDATLLLSLLGGIPSNLGGGRIYARGQLQRSRTRRDREHFGGVAVSKSIERAGTLSFSSVPYPSHQRALPWFGA